MLTLKENIKKVFDDLFKNIDGTWKIDVDVVRLFDNPLWYPIYPPRFTFEARPKTGYKNERKCFEILRKYVQSRKEKEDVLLIFNLERLMCDLVNDNLKECVDQIKKELKINSGLTTDFILIDKKYGIFLIDSKGRENEKNLKKATDQGKVFKKIMTNYIDGLDDSYFQILPYYTTNREDENFTNTFISRMSESQIKRMSESQIKRMSDKLFKECVNFLLHLKYNDYRTRDEIIKEDNDKHGTALDIYVSGYEELNTIGKNPDIKKRIIAGPAGCGKTQVIKHKVAKLIESKKDLTLIVLSSQTEKMYSYINGLSFKNELKQHLKQYFYFYFDEKKEFELVNIKDTFKRLDFSKITSIEIFISRKDKINCFFKIICNDICYFSDYAIRSKYEKIDDDISELISYFRIYGEFCFKNVTIYYDYDYKTNAALLKFLDLFKEVSFHWETEKIQKIEMEEADLDKKLDEMKNFKGSNFINNTSRDLDIFISIKEKIDCFFKITCGDICYLLYYSFESGNNVICNDDISTFISSHSSFDLETGKDLRYKNVTIYHDSDLKTNVALSNFLDCFDKVCLKKERFQKIHEANLDKKLLELFKFSVFLVEHDPFFVSSVVETSFYSRKKSRPSFDFILSKIITYCNNKVDVLIDDFQAYGFLEKAKFLEIDEEKKKKIDNLWITLDLYQIMRRKIIDNEEMLNFNNEEFSFTFMNKVLRCSKKIFDIIEPIYNYMSMDYEDDKYEDILIRIQKLNSNKSSCNIWFNCYECFSDRVKANKEECINTRNLSQDKEENKKGKKEKIKLNITYNDFIKYYKKFELNIKCGYEHEADGEVRILPIEYSNSELEIINKLIKTVSDRIEELLELFYAKSIAVYIDTYRSRIGGSYKDIFNVADDLDLHKSIFRGKKILESLNKPQFKNIYIVDDRYKDKEFSAEFDAVVYIAPGILNTNDEETHDYLGRNRMNDKKTNPYLFISRAIHDLTIIYVRCKEDHPRPYHKQISFHLTNENKDNCSTNTCSYMLIFFFIIIFILNFDFVN